VDRNRLKETLRKVASSGIQVAGTMAGALTGRGTVVLDSAGYRLLNPVTSDARGMVGGSNDRNSLVRVEAGRSGEDIVADRANAGAAKRKWSMRWPIPVIVLISSCRAWTISPSKTFSLNGMSRDKTISWCKAWRVASSR